MHFRDEAERANIQEIERHSALEPEFRKAGLKLSGRGFRSGDEWNAWALKLVDTWQKQHSILLAAQELAAVWSEHADAIDREGLNEELDRSTSFVDMMVKSRKFRANIATLEVKGAMAGQITRSI